MIKSEERINETLKGKGSFLFSYRTIASKKDKYSIPRPYTEDSSKFLYNSKLIDGVKFIFDTGFTLSFNARHNFY